jgi:hypothetical protein
MRRSNLFIIYVLLLCSTSCGTSSDSFLIDDADARLLASKATQKLFQLPCSTIPSNLNAEVLDWQYDVLHNKVIIQTKITWQGGFLNSDWYLIGQFSCNPSGCETLWKLNNYNKLGDLFICESRLHEQHLGCINN